MVTTIETVFKEGNNYTKEKPNVMKESITPTIEKKKIDTVNKTEKSQASNKNYIYPEAINTTKVNHWMNQGLLK